MLGEEPDLLEAPRRVERRGGLVREDPQRLHELPRRDEPVLGIVGPDDGDHLALAVEERDDEPVPVPGPGATAVHHRPVHAVAGREPQHRLLVREQVAALDLERRVEKGRELPHRERSVLGQLVERPAGRRTRDEHPRPGVGELNRDLPEPQRVPDPLAGRLEDRLDRRRLGEPRRHLQELAKREPVMGGRGLLLEALEGEGDVVGDRHEHLQLLVRRARARVGLTDRQDPQHVPVGVEHRHEQLVVGVPRVGVGARLPGGDVPLADVALPVERPVRDQIGAAALEPLVEERSPRGPVEGVAEERPACVVGAVHRRHLEVVPRGTVEVDDDGVEPERRRDRIRDGLEQGRLLGPFPDEPGDLQEAAKAVDGRRVLGHGAAEGSAKLEPG